jgi:putative RecB family exonuclease
VSDVKPELPAHLSASSIQTYIQCPLKFKLSRVDKIQEPPTMQTLLGNFVHDVLEHFYVAYQPEERTVVSARHACTHVWSSGGWADRVAPYLKRTPINDFRWSAWWCVENIFLLENPSLVQPSGIEYEVLGEIDGVLIKGFIDRWTEIDGVVTITDYKTGKTPAPKYMADKWFQLSLYAILLAELENKQSFNLELLYLKDGVAKKHLPTADDFSSTRNTITTTKKEIVNSYDNSTWTAIPSNLCNWCHFKSNLCTYWNPKDE